MRVVRHSVPDGSVDVDDPLLGTPEPGASAPPADFPFGFAA
ncbi:MAG: hypothetical protein ACI9HK_004867 [Pirellulaceae bacterium]|jgi:hypothetical protein